MPNHVINEIIFRGVTSQEARDRILEKVRNAKGEIDFEILVPAPLNIWCGSVSTKHEKGFPGTHLDWARANWGTKWNACGLNQGGRYKSIEEDGDSLTLRFQTAWSPPMGWIVALFNYFKLPFEHNWLSEGGDQGTCGKFDYAALDDMGRDAWVETPADDTMQKYLHKLLWGVESFPEEAA